MKGKSYGKYIPLYIILILVLYMNGCGGSTTKTPVEQKSQDDLEIKKPGNQKPNKKTNRNDFEKEALVALELHPSVPDAIYDPEAPVVIRVELYSPRSFAVSNHNQYKTKEAEAIKLPEAKVDQSGKPWWQEITLTYTSSDGSTGELKFQTGNSPEENVLDLGKGDVGSLELIIAENSFGSEGKFSIKAAWNSSKYGMIESENLPITLAKDHMSDEERNLLRVKVLLAKEEIAAALPMVKKLAENNPDSYPIRFYLAETHEKNNNLKEALTQYLHAQILFPEEKPDEPWEPPVGLYIKIRELMKKLGKGKKSDQSKNELHK